MQVLVLCRGLPACFGWALGLWGEEGAVDKCSSDFHRFSGPISPTRTFFFGKLQGKAAGEGEGCGKCKKAEHFLDEAVLLWPRIFVNTGFVPGPRAH